MNISYEIPSDQQFITVQELKSKGLSQYNVSKLVERGALIKLTKKAYEITDYHGEESDLYYVNAYIPNGVICLLSAASYWDLTTYIPDSINVAIPRKSRVSTLPEWPQISISYFTDDRYQLGITEITEGRNHFLIYNTEKTVVDIVFYREKVGIEETKEILTTYLRRKDRNLNLLLEYAGQLKCEGIMRQYLDVLV